MNPRQQQAVDNFNSAIAHALDELMVKTIKDENKEIKLDLLEIGKIIQNAIKLKQKSYNEKMALCDQAVALIMQNSALIEKCKAEVVLLSDAISKLDHVIKEAEVTKKTGKKLISKSSVSDKPTQVNPKQTKPEHTKLEPTKPLPKSKFSLFSIFKKSKKEKKKKSSIAPKLK